MKKIGEVSHALCVQKILGVANEVASNSEDYCGFETSVSLTAEHPTGLQYLVNVGVTFIFGEIPYIGMNTQELNFAKEQLLAFNGPAILLSEAGYGQFQIWNYVEVGENAMVIGVWDGQPNSGLCIRRTLNKGCSREQAKAIISSAAAELQRLQEGT